MRSPDFKKSASLQVSGTLRLYTISQLQLQALQLEHLHFTANFELYHSRHQLFIVSYKTSSSHIRSVLHPQHTRWINSYYLINSIRSSLSLHLRFVYRTLRIEEANMKLQSKLGSSKIRKGHIKIIGESERENFQRILLYLFCEQSLQYTPKDCQLYSLFAAHLRKLRSANFNNNLSLYYEFTPHLLRAEYSTIAEIADSEEEDYI